MKLRMLTKKMRVLAWSTGCSKKYWRNFWFLPTLISVIIVFGPWVPLPA